MSDLPQRDPDRQPWYYVTLAVFARLPLIVGCVQLIAFVSWAVASVGVAIVFAAFRAVMSVVRR
jgi:hypothetical protein